MEYFIVSILNGISYGLLLFMVSAGLTLIFGMMGILNFAHASFYMIGGYIGYVCTKAGSFGLGLVLAPILVGLFGAWIERGLLRKIHRFGHAHELLLTFGIALIIKEIVILLFGDHPVGYPVPAQLRFAAFKIFETSYPFYRVFIGIVAVSMLLLLLLLVLRTRAGLIVRAAERLPIMTEVLGHNVPLAFSGVFGIGSALAGLAGAVAGAFLLTSPNMALDLGVIAFVVVVLGGLGSLVGSFLASMIIGISTSIAVGWEGSLSKLLVILGLPLAGGWLGEILSISVSSISSSIPVLVMLAVLLIRPAGLMGERN